MSGPRRLYREVRVNNIGPGAWQILLNGKPAATPAGNLLLLPTHTLANEIAGEWRRQAGRCRLESMALTRLANTAIDRTATGREAAISELLNYAGSDLLCYRASDPDELVKRQTSVWNPLLDWARKDLGIRLITSSSISLIEQSTDDLDRLRSLLLTIDKFSLVGLVAAANILGSAVLGLALRAGRIDATEAFEAAELDAIYQAELWGEDADFAARSQALKYEVFEIKRFFDLNRTV